MLSWSSPIPSSFPSTDTTYTKIASAEIFMMHPALLNRVLLENLLKADLLAAAALAYCTCSSLDEFIFDNVVTPSALAGFLRQHQYALLHDNYYKHFSSSEDTLIRFTIHRLLSRYDASLLFTSIAEYLGPVIAHTPLPMFWKSPPISPDFRVYLPPDAKERSLSVPSNIIEFGFESVLSTPWMYATWFLKGNEYGWICIVNNLQPHPVLRADFLFSKRYVDLYDTAREVTGAGMELWWKAKRSAQPQSVLDVAAKISTVFESSRPTDPLAQIQQKWCLCCFLVPGIEENKISAATFQSLFELDLWKGLWTFPELGRWLSLGLRSFGRVDFLETIIETSFKSKLDGLLWMFLGAHGWFSTTRPRVEDKFAFDETRTCCRSSIDGKEAKYIVSAVKTLNENERIWLAVQAVRMAPEYGVCRDLGANLFNYLVRDCEGDGTFGALVHEICLSRMQHLFEHSIGLAIANSDTKRLPIPGPETREYKRKLQIRNGELFQLLK